MVKIKVNFDLKIRNAQLLSNSKKTISGEGKRAPSGGAHLEQSGDPLENRLQITDLELLKQAFDVFKKYF